MDCVLDHWIDDPCLGRTAHPAPVMTPVVDQHTGPTAGRLQADRPVNGVAVDGMLLHS